MPHPPPPSRQPKARPTFRRKLAFLAILCCVGLLLLLVAEFALRAFVPPPADPFLHLQGRTTVFSEVVEDGQRLFKITHPSAYRDANTSVEVEKPRGTLRVFCLGGSASAGWPHPKDQTFPAYLEAALQRAFPSNRIQVVNAGAHAFASYRVRMIFDQIVDLAPDLIVVWCGNNEFIEKRSYFVGALADLVRGIERHSRVAQVVLGALRDALQPDNRLDAEGGVDQAYHTWTHTEQVALELRRDPAQFAAVNAHYTHSIEHMVTVAGQRGVPIVLLTVPSNLRDWRPNVSITETTSGAGYEAWRTVFLAARGARLSGDLDRAIIGYEDALRREPQHADSWFELGRCFEASDRDDDARRAYLAAKDADANPFRALTTTNEIVRAIASRHPGTTLVDAEAAMQAATKLPAPGFDLFLDYVHPTRAGNLVVAKAVHDAILSLRLLPGGDATSAFAPPDGREYSDANDVNVQGTLLALFSTMHQYESFVAKVDEFDALGRRLGVTFPAPIVEFLAECRARFTEYLVAERAEALGEPHDREFREKHRAFYREGFGRIAQLRGQTQQPGK
jgi:tetratricopeptide (TPR) repeat protein